MADVRELSNEDLIYHWIITARELQESRRMKDTIEDELTSRLEEDGATEYVAPDGGKVTLTESGGSYDPSKLMGLMEYIDESELITAGAFTPEHEETNTVPAKWNAVKAKPFGKRGDDVRAVIEGARVPGRPKLTVTPAEVLK